VVGYDQRLEQFVLAPHPDFVKCKDQRRYVLRFGRLRIDAYMAAIGSNDLCHGFDLLRICHRSELHGHASRNDLRPAKIYELPSLGQLLLRGPEDVPLLGFG